VLGLNLPIHTVWELSSYGLATKKNANQAINKPKNREQNIYFVEEYMLIKWIGHRITIYGSLWEVKHLHSLLCNRGDHSPLSSPTWIPMQNYIFFSTSSLSMRLCIGFSFFWRLPSLNPLHLGLVLSCSFEKPIIVGKCSANMNLSFNTPTKNKYIFIYPSFKLAVVVNTTVKVINSSSLRVQITYRKDALLPH
jgi:hypothetical protein